MHWASDMNDAVIDFVSRLVLTSPELTKVYRQHIEDQGELLPHVLMGEITRLVIASAINKQVDWLPKLLQQLEVGLVSGNADIADLVGVSFVENMTGEYVTIQALAPVMGAALRREVKLICGV